MMKTLILEGNDVLGGIGRLEFEKRVCPQLPPKLTNEISPPTSMKLEITVIAKPGIPRIDVTSPPDFSSLHDKNPVIELYSCLDEFPSSDRSEQEMSAAEALLELALPMKWGHDSEGQSELTEDSSSGYFPSSGEIPEIPEWLLDPLPLKRVKSTNGTFLNDLKYFQSTDIPTSSKDKVKPRLSQKQKSFRQPGSKTGIKVPKFDLVTKTTLVKEHVPKKSLPGSQAPRKFSCSLCLKEYANSANLSRHKQVHRSTNSKYAKTCDICHKKYVSRPAFVMHIMTHFKIYKCTACSKSFSRKWSLESHIRSHTGEKPYPCYLCGRPFSDKSNMIAHTAIHQQGTKLPCPLCPKVFWISAYYKKHLKKVHSKSKAELASLISKKSTRQRVLRLVT